MALAERTVEKVNRVGPAKMIFAWMREIPEVCLRDNVLKALTRSRTQSESEHDDASHDRPALTSDVAESGLDPMLFLSPGAAYITRMAPAPLSTSNPPSQDHPITSSPP